MVAVQPISRNDPVSPLQLESSSPYEIKKTPPQPHRKDTLSSAKNEARFLLSDHPTSKPKLPLPDYRTRMIQLSDKIAETNQRLVERDLEHIRQNHQSLRDLEEKRTNIFLENAKKATEKETWQMLEEAASIIMASGSLVIGVTLISTGNLIPGSLLIGSGMSSLISYALNQMDVHPYLSGAFALAGAAFGIAGTMTGYGTLTKQIPRMFITITNSVFGIIQGTTTFGQQYSEAQISWFQSELKNIMSLLKIGDIENQKLLSETTTTMKRLAFSSEVSKDLLEEDARMKASILAQQI